MATAMAEARAPRSRVPPATARAMSRVLIEPNVRTAQSGQTGPSEVVLPTAPTGPNTQIAPDVPSAPTVLSAPALLLAPRGPLPGQGEAGPGERGDGRGRKRAGTWMARVKAVVRRRPDSGASVPAILTATPCWRACRPSSAPLRSSS